MSQSTPFLLEAQLESPVIISPEAYLTLDSLLSASYRAFGEDDSHLPLKKTRDVYHGSAAILVGNPIHLEAPFVSRMTLRDYSDYPILPNKRSKRGDSKLVVNLNAFPHMARLDRYPAFHYPTILWFGNGDPAKTHELVARLPGIGKRYNSGFGQFSSISVLPLPMDFSFKLPNQTPARPIPLELCDRLGFSAFRVDKTTYGVATEFGKNSTLRLFSGS